MALLKEKPVIILQIDNYGLYYLLLACGLQKVDQQIIYDCWIATFMGLMLAVIFPNFR